MTRTILAAALVAATLATASPAHAFLGAVRDFIDRNAKYQGPGNSGRDRLFASTRTRDIEARMRALDAAYRAPRSTITPADYDREMAALSQGLRASRQYDDLILSGWDPSCGNSTRCR